MINKDLYSRNSLKQYLMVLVGAFIIAAAEILFINPYKFMPGGVYGICIMIHHLTQGTFEMFPNGLPIGAMALAIDIPLTIIGTKILGPKFGYKTVLGFTSMSVFTTMLEYWWGYDPLVANEPLLSAIFGGVLIGIGSGIVFKAHATTGGSDIVAAIIAKYTRGQLGLMQIYVDSAIVLMALAAFGDWSIPLFSWIIIFITGKCIDVVLQGLNVEKALIIISDRHDEIREIIIKKMDRGGTYLTGNGMYENADKRIIFTVLSRRQAELLKDFIREIDPRAFMAILDSSEVLGEGFKDLKEEK